MQKCYEGDMIRPETENQSKRYPIYPKINMWSNKEPSNGFFNFDIIPSWFDVLFHYLVLYGRNQLTSFWTIFFPCLFFFIILLIYFGY